MLLYAHRVAPQIKQNLGCKHIAAKPRPPDALQIFAMPCLRTGLHCFVRFRLKLFS